MATRCLTDVFMLMRNSASQSRHMYGNASTSHSRFSQTTPLTAYVDVDDEEEEEDDNDDARAALVPRRRRRDNCGARETLAPPAWLTHVDAVLLRCERVEQWLSRLAELRQQQLSRPTLDDTAAGDDQRRAEQLQDDIGQQLRECQRHLQQLQSAVASTAVSSSGAISRQQLLGDSVILALVTRVQHLSAAFSSSQTDFLREHSLRERRAQRYFDAMIYEEQVDGTIESGDYSGADSSATAALSFDDLQFLSSGGGGAQLTQQQLLQLHEDTSQLRQRDRQVQQLVSSLADLNSVFHQLASMVSGQGELVDRIDVAVESAQSRVGQALQQLRTADKHQKKGRKMQLLMLLAAFIVLLFIILVSSS